MNNTMRHRISLRFFFVILFLGLSLYFPIIVKAAGVNNSFWVKFIDVGQGDCALIQCDGHYMMIDGGPSKASSTVYTILKDSRIKNIDIMIATHPDEDHIGGLSGALNYSSVGVVLSPVTAHDTKTFNNLMKYVVKQGKSLTVPKAGDIYSLGSAKVIIAGPVVNSTDTNNKSIVVKVIYGNNSFMFMGDAEDEEEASIVQKYTGLDSDVLKVGHHGSKSSTSTSFLKAVNPSYAVISVGKDNSYSHPTQDVLDKLSKSSVLIYRTDLQGDILFHSDGKKLWVETEKSASEIEILNGASTKSVNGAPVDGNDLSIPAGTIHVLNTNSKKYHVPTCSSVRDISVKNIQFSNATSGELISLGYVACQRCGSGTTTKAPADKSSATALEQSLNSVASDSYVLNTNTKKFHYPSCSSVGDMKPKNRKDVTMLRDDIISKGYVPCKRCKP